MYETEKVGGQFLKYHVFVLQAAVYKRWSSSTVRLAVDCRLKEANNLILGSISFRLWDEVDWNIMLGVIGTYAVILLLMRTATVAPEISSFKYL